MTRHDCLMRILSGIAPTQQLHALFFSDCGGNQLIILCWAKVITVRSPSRFRAPSLLSARLQTRRPGHRRPAVPENGLVATARSQTLAPPHAHLPRFVWKEAAPYPFLLWGEMDLPGEASPLSFGGHWPIVLSSGTVLRTCCCSLLTGRLRRRVMGAETCANGVSGRVQDFQVPNTVGGAIRHRGFSVCNLRPALFAKHMLATSNNRSEAKGRAESHTMVCLSASFSPKKSRKRRTERGFKNKRGKRKRKEE